MQDSARQKELDMLEKISDAETVRSLREQERARKEAEEWRLQAKLMVCCKHGCCTNVPFLHKHVMICLLVTGKGKIHTSKT